MQNIVLHTLEKLELLSDATSAGAQLRGEFAEVGFDSQPVTQMLEGFAEEVTRILASCPLEPRGELYQSLLTARQANGASQWREFAERLAAFVESAAAEVAGLLVPEQ